MKIALEGPGRVGRQGQGRSYRIIFDNQAIIAEEVQFDKDNGEVTITVGLATPALDDVLARMKVMKGPGVGVRGKKAKKG